MKTRALAAIAFFAIAGIVGFVVRGHSFPTGGGSSNGPAASAGGAAAASPGHTDAFTKPEIAQPAQALGPSAIPASVPGSSRTPSSRSR
jgi:hypothetical protein